MCVGFQVNRALLVSDALPECGSLADYTCMYML